MATSKVTGDSQELSAAIQLAATDRMDIDRFGRLSLVDASTGATPTPHRTSESQTPSGRKADEVPTTISEESTETATAVHGAIRRRDKEGTSQQTSSSQPHGGGVYLPKPDRVGTVVLNPTVPAFQPLVLGNSQVARYGSGTTFTPYQSVRSVPTIRRVPPWRIDKWYRYRSSSDPFRSRRPKRATSPPRAGWRKLLFQDPLIHLPAPVPTSKYISQASRPPQRLQEPQSLLLVIDLNGTLVARNRMTRSIVPRTSLNQFLGYCLEQHFILIWSSAMPASVVAMCKEIFSSKQRRQLLGEWDRDTFGLTHQQYTARVQVYKRLDRIWDSSGPLGYLHPDSQKGVVWDQRNTVLIDDSALKASAQPHNLLEVPEFTEEKADSPDVLVQVIRYLEKLKMYDDVSSYIRETPFRTYEDGATAGKGKSGLGDMDANATKQQIAPMSR